MKVHSTLPESNNTADTGMSGSMALPDPTVEETIPHLFLCQYIFKSSNGSSQVNQETDDTIEAGPARAACCFTLGSRIGIIAVLFGRGYSSAGRALAWHARGQRFDPAYLHQRLAYSFSIGPHRLEA